MTRRHPWSAPARLVHGERGVRGLQGVIDATAKGVGREGAWSGEAGPSVSGGGSGGGRASRRRLGVGEEGTRAGRSSVSGG